MRPAATSCPRRAGRRPPKTHPRPNPDPPPPANGEQARLAEPGDDAKVERQQQRHRVEDGAIAEVDERAVGEGEEDESEEEPTPPDEESEQRATPEDHQRRGVH